MGDKYTLNDLFKDVYVTRIDDFMSQTYFVSMDGKRVWVVPRHTYMLVNVVRSLISGKP